jgi:hypothetical protein
MQGQATGQVPGSAVPLSKLASDCENEGLTSENCLKIVAEIAKNLGVFDDEVAILRVVGKSHLIFVYPEKLAQVGIIPLNNSSSVAARTVLMKRAEVLNNFAQVKHASIFEAVPVTSRARGSEPTKSGNMIQKLMTVPVSGNSGVVGVIQVSRKGMSPQAAGRDFTASDLQKLISMAAVLAKCFK